MVKPADMAEIEVQETDGDLEAVVAVVVTERNAATREAEVEVIAENATDVAVDEATVVVTREVVVPLAIVTRSSVRVTGVVRDDLPAVAKERIYTRQVNFFLRPYKSDVLEG